MSSISIQKKNSAAKFCNHKSNIKVLLAYDSLIYPTTIGVIGAFLRTLGSNLYQEQRTLKSKPSRIICLAPQNLLQTYLHTRLAKIVYINTKKKSAIKVKQQPSFSLWNFSLLFGVTDLLFSYTYFSPLSKMIMQD